MLKAGPATVNPGDTITYTVQVTNLGPSVAASVVITDTLPATGTFVNASAGGSNTAGVITWPTLATMTPADTVTYTVTFVAPASGAFTNVAAATTTTAEADLTNNDGSGGGRVTTTVNPTSGADLRLSKSGPAAAIVGDTVTYIVTVVNTGPDAAANVNVADTLPTAGTFVSASAGGTHVGGVVTWPTVGTLAAGDTVQYTVDFAPSGTGSITNVATVASSTPDPVPGNETDSATTTVSATLADLVVTKAGPASVNPGDTIVYQVQVTNRGPNPATSVVVTDTLPTTGSFVSASNGGVNTAGVVTWPTLPTVTTADTIAYTVAFVAPATGAFTNIAAGTTATSESDPSNNNGTGSGRVTTTVTSGPTQADVRVVKTGPSTAMVGDTVTYGITVMNDGPGAAANVTVTDQLPSGLVFVSATGGGAESGGLITWPVLPSLANGAAAAFTVRAVVQATGTLVNTAYANSTSTDPNVNNNNGSMSMSQVTTTVVAGADLSVFKSGPASAAPGDTLTYTLTVRNAGPSVATDVVVTDSLPRGLAFLSASHGGTETGSAQGSVVTWPAVATLAVGAEITRTIQVVAGDAGVRRNVARVSGTTADPDPSNDRDVAVTGIASAPDLQLTKSHSGDLVAGREGTYVLSIANIGQGPTLGPITVVDTLPTGLTFVSVSGTGWTATANGSVVTAIRTTTLAAGATTQIALRVDVGPNAGPSVLNRAHVSTDGDPNPGNDSDDDLAEVGVIDLSLSKVATGPFEVGGLGTFTFTVINEGTVATSGAISVVDTLPAGLVYESIQGAGWSASQSGGVVTAVHNQVLAAGASTSFTMTVRISSIAAGPGSNTATVRTDGDPGDQDTAEYEVGSGSELVVEKTSARAEVEVGDVIDYSITVSVVGTAPVPEVEILDDLPPGFRYVPGTSRRDGQPTLDPAGGVGPQLTWPIGLLPAGGSTTITYRVSVGPEATTADGVNRATAQSPTTGKRSNVALAAVRLRPGAFTDEGLITGKVYLECGCEVDGQDLEELGVPGVRVLLQDGTSAVTDSEGKYHFFGLSPRTWVVMIDPATLPAGVDLARLSNRHSEDGRRVLVDLKRGELARADFADASRSAAVLADVKARRTAGEVTSLLLDPTAPEQRAAQRRATDGTQGTRLFRSILQPGRDGLNARNSMRAPRGGEMLPLVDSTAMTRDEAPGSSLELVPGPGSVTADGVTRVPVSIRFAPGVSSRAGRVTLEASDGRWLVLDADTTAPGLQVELSGGAASFEFESPDRVGRVTLRASLDNEQPVREELYIEPRGHDMIAAGLLEARLDLRTPDLSNLTSGAERNRFEDALESISAESDDGRLGVGARASLFAQGRVRGDLNLTLRLDTEEDERSRLFRDIRPDEFYPVYGDAAIQAFDAQSKGRFFGRLERGASFLQYGDFNTSSDAYGQAGAMELGRYSRTLNGALQHYESERLAVDAFASRDRFMQVVDELRGQGISGPYQLSRAEGLVNSERVELVTRDRNQPAVILRTEVLERFTDYTIEPFSGRLVFKRPIPSVDPELNPVAIRVTYEVETGGDAFWVYGANARVRASDRLEIGGGYVRDDNATSPFDLASVNATLALARGTFLVGEWARSDSAGSAAGDARRLELRHASSRFDGRLFYLDSDVDFENPSQAYGNGRTEVGFRGFARLDDRTALFGEGLRTEDQRSGGVRRGWSAGVERAFGTWMRGRLGYRWADETTAPADQGTAQSPGATPNETHAVSARVTGRLPWLPQGSVFGEFEQDVSEASQRRLAVGGDYRLLGRARLYGRHEFITSLAGPYALNTEQDRNTTVFGIAADVLPGQSVFSEYRVRDAIGGREAQAAIGLRNRWEVRDGVRLSSSLERLAPLSEGGASATAITGGIEYTASPLWRGSARAEYRNAESGDNLFGSVGYARKLSRDWTLLGSSLFSTMVDGDRAFERTRLGVAYRQTDRNRWTGLARYEHRYDRNPDLSSTETRRTAHVFAGHLNYQPNLDWVLRGQWASKWANERSGGFATSTQAHLAGLRTTVDLTDRFDIGAVGRVLLAGAFESAQWGLGGEVGLTLRDQIRLSAGYNVFGFSDGDFSDLDQTDHGFYVQLGMTFDEGLFGRGDDDAATGTSAARADSHTEVPHYEPNQVVRRILARPYRDLPAIRDTLTHADLRITDEAIAEDSRVIDNLVARAARAADTTSAEATYRTARAIALGGIATVEFTDNDRTGFAEGPGAALGRDRSGAGEGKWGTGDRLAGHRR